MSAKLHQGYATGSRDIQNGQVFSGQSSYMFREEGAIFKKFINNG